jgi:sensor histidine kinase YesM
MPLKLPKLHLLELATEPGIKNFLFLLVLWYAGIVMYTMLGPSPWTFVFRMVYYTKWSWLNFVLTYTLAVWAIPYSLKHQKYITHVVTIVVCLGAYILARYLYHTYLEPEYYTTYSAKNEKSPYPWYEIVQFEFTRGAQFVFIAYAFRLFIDRVLLERNRRALEQAKLKSELATLRYQLSPHFLFNALNSIYAMALRKSDLTADALLKLSDMFRYVLHQQDELVPIGQEIEHLKRMIDFEHIRFPNSAILTRWQIQPGTEHMMVPPLLLSTFVENAFKHGDPRTNEQPISIRLNLSKQKLEYVVVNPISRSNPENGHAKGLGLYNLGKRLQLTYPDNHFVETVERDWLFFAKIEINL